MIHQIWFLLQHYDMAALFGLLTVEEAGVPIPIPGDIIMIYAGYRVHLGLMLWYEALLAGVLATLIGSCVLYHVGRRGGRPLLIRYGGYLHLDTKRQDRIERWLSRNGGLAVFLGRLIPGMRCGSSFVAGTFGVPYPTFVVATAASATVWWGTFLIIGSRLGALAAPLLARHHHAWLFLFAFVLLGAAVPLYVRFRMAQENDQLSKRPRLWPVRLK